MTVAVVLSTNEVVHFKGEPTVSRTHKEHKSTHKPHTKQSGINQKHRKHYLNPMRSLGDSNFPTKGPT